MRENVDDVWSRDMLTVRDRETDVLMAIAEWPLGDWPLSSEWIGHAAVADWTHMLNRWSLKSGRVVHQRLSSSKGT